MAATDLSFTKTTDAQGRDVWTGKFTATGRSVVHLKRASAGNVYVYASVDGMDAYPIYNGGAMGNGGSNFLVEVDVMAGMAVQIDSYSEVTSGKVLTEDA